MPLPSLSHTTLGPPLRQWNYGVKSWVRTPTIGTICIWLFLCPEARAQSTEQTDSLLQRNSLYQGSNLWAFHPAKHTHSPCGKQPGSPFISNRALISLCWNDDKCGLISHSTNPFIKVQMGRHRGQVKEQWKAEHGGQVNPLEVDLLLFPDKADKQLSANLQFTRRNWKCFSWCLEGWNCYYCAHARVHKITQKLANLTYLCWRNE